MNALSLFCSSGIGDLGLNCNHINVVAACELLEDRSKLFQENFPETRMFQGDIKILKKSIIDYYRENFDETPFLILATPPCQGMSSNGMGKMLSDYRKGLRPKYDERNQLIIEAVDIIKELQPKWVIFENVPNMNNTIIMDRDGAPINIIDFVFRELSNYTGDAQVVNTADYGIPQIRKRLITILTNTENGEKYYENNKSFLPCKTNDEKGINNPKWITLREAIGNLPELDAIPGKNDRSDFHVLHKVAVMDPKKYEWVKNTKEGDTAFNNQCINPECMYKGNKLHSSIKVDGVNTSSKETPLYCEKCGALLPRPFTIDSITKQKRIMKGYVSAYKRMNYDIPASTLTMNFPYVSSDNKIHPTQNRPLSIYEATILQTISDYDYVFNIDGKQVSDNLIIETIGESVPPKLIDLIVKKILEI